MREFKVLRMNFITDEVDEEYMMFETANKADDWATVQNADRNGAVLSMTDVTKHNDNKHEY